MLEIKYNYDLEEYYIKTKIGKQTFYMAFQLVEETGDTAYFNVYMTLYNKRKQITNNETMVKMTGENPIQTVITAKKAFNQLEEELVKEYTKDYGLKVVIYCTWLNTKRKNVYYKILNKKGYEYGRKPDCDSLCIMKTFYSTEDLK